MLLAVGEPGLVVLLGGGELVQPGGRLLQAGPTPAGVLGQTRLQGHPQRLVQVVQAFTAGLGQRAAQAVQRVAGDLGQVQCLAQLPGPAGGGQALVGAARGQIEGALQGERPGQVATGGQGLQDPGRRHAGPQRFGAAAQPPQRSGQQMQIGAGPERILLGLAQVERDPQRPLGLGPVIQQGILLGQVFVQQRPGRPVGRPGEPQRPFVLGGGFAVGTEGRGRPGRDQRVAQHRLGVPRALAVVGQQGRVGVGPIGQHGQPPRVQRDLPGRGDRIRHRHPEQLVPEAQVGSVGDQDAGGQAFVDGGRGIQYGRQLIRGDPRTGYGGGLDGPAGGRAARASRAAAASGPWAEWPASLPRAPR